MVFTENQYHPDLARDIPWWAYLRAFEFSSLTNFYAQALGRFSQIRPYLVYVCFSDGRKIVLTLRREDVDEDMRLRTSFVRDYV